MRLPRNVEVMSGRSRDKAIWFARNMTGITNDVPKSYMIEVTAVFCLWKIVRKFHISCFCCGRFIVLLHSLLNSFLNILSFIGMKYIIFKIF